MNDDENFAASILWTDESQFTKDGITNYHNEHRWSENNPHAIRPQNFQHRFSVNVWAGICGEHLIGPHFFEGTLNSVRYLEFLESELGNLLDDVPLQHRQRMIFQHDGAPPHYGVNVRRWLNVNFPERWIGRAGPIPWPPRSPDITPLDFYLWGDVKRVVYSTQPESREELIERITNAFDSIRQNNTLFDVERSVIHRVNLCLKNEGGHFEQHLN
jgi:hypothetical protein